MLLFAIFGIGFGAGALAQVILGTKGRGIDWMMAMIAGFGGAFLGGMIFSLIAGDGISLKPSGLFGAILGAVIITAIWQYFRRRKAAAESAAAKQRARSGRPR